MRQDPLKLWAMLADERITGISTDECRVMPPLILLR